jgi:carbon-monoxide dehydrogenase iron sulfur subunit
MKIWLDPRQCKGCLRCELACSFYQSGCKIFNPELSSTKVFRSNQDKKISMMIDDTCNECIDVEIPYCVKACVFGARGIREGG